MAFKTYPKRSILCVSLFVGQAFLYNGVTFNLGTLMTTFYGISAATVPVFIIIYAIGNFSPRRAAVRPQAPSQTASFHASRWCRH